MSREAMKQALEALEKVTKHFTRTPSTLMDSEARVEAHNAITALRQALETEKQWLSLTDQEVWKAIDDVLEGGGWLDVARVLEQAFKEKNT